MLREIAHVRQEAGIAQRRWFSSATMDLMIWYASAGQIRGFQLCYDKLGLEKAVTWKRGSPRLHHADVSSGENVGLNYKQSPLLGADTPLDAKLVSELFQAEAQHLPDAIRQLVQDTLAAHQQS